VSQHNLLIVSNGNRTEELDFLIRRHGLWSLC